MINVWSMRRNQTARGISFLFHPFKLQIAGGPIKVYLTIQFVSTFLKYYLLSPLLKVLDSFSSKSRTPALYNGLEASHINEKGQGVPGS